MATIKNVNITNVGYLLLPKGTTSQRPVSPIEGMIRYNTTLKIYEYYSSLRSAWIPFCFI